MEVKLLGSPVSTNSLYKYTCVGGFLHGYMSKEGKARKEEYAWAFKAARPSRWDLRRKIKVEVKLFFENNRCRDIDNYSKILLDAASGIIWDDDSQIVSLHLSKAVDSKNPRIEMVVKPLAQPLSSQLSTA